jgi:protoporphyrinogen/coproporphyrinogen III oxidase
VVGAGISGLACAHRLKQNGIAPLVLEAEDRPGGLIATVRRNGLVFEGGPQFPRFPAPVWTLVRELGLESEFVSGDRKAHRYILRDGRLHPAPFSPASAITTRLVDFKSKFRILTEAFRRSYPPAHEESLAGFIKRKFGSDVLDYLVDPFISTIFFSDPHKMGIESAFPVLAEWERTQGSLIRGAIRARKSRQANLLSRAPSAPTGQNTNGGTLHVAASLPAFGSFKSGMAILPERLAEELEENIRYRAGLESVARTVGSNGKTELGWRLRLSGGEEITTEFLVLAVPAYEGARLLKDSVHELGTLLKGIEYEPVCVVSSAYHRSLVSHRLNGFGFMVPRREGLHAFCTFWNSSLFPSHAPEGMVLMTSFAGRGADESLAALAEEHYAQMIEAENAKILGVTGEPSDRTVWRFARALPQYNVGHAARVGEIERALRTFPNLYLGGNFLRGRSIGDCVEIAFRVAADLHRRVRGQNIQIASSTLKETSS